MRAVGPEAGRVRPLPCAWVSNAPMFDDSRQVHRKLQGGQVLWEGVAGHRPRLVIERVQSRQLLCH